MLRQSLLMTTVILLALLLIAGTAHTTSAQTPTLLPKEQLGKSIFNDLNLSINQNQACASCHAPEVGWTGPLADINESGAVYEGSIPGRFGNRKPPSTAYATLSPIFHLVTEKGDDLFVGGNFWNGRATGERLGNPAADQALGPFLNPLEQALPDFACVVYRVCNPTVSGDYPVLFEEVWGASACDFAWPTDVNASCADEGGTVALSTEDRTNVAAAYDQIGLTIAAFEASSESNAFTSKYDYYLMGLVKLTKEEKKGMNFFKGKGKCDSCHPMDLGPDGELPLFTDFTFDNLGIPRNPDNPFYSQTAFNTDGYEWVDSGLGAFLETRADYAAYAEDAMGMQKVPTLRNVDLRPSAEFTKTFGHNGYFKSLKGIVHFYSTRDNKPTCADPFTTEADALAQGCWPEAEITDNINTRELGKLNLTDAQEDAIVAFLKTLNDGYPMPVTAAHHGDDANRVFLPAVQLSR